MHGDLDAPYPYEVGLLEEDWDARVASRGELCVSILQELITRRTDRAYYHLRDNVALERGPDAIWLVESRWVHLWGSVARRENEERGSSPDAIAEMLMLAKICCG